MFGSVVHSFSPGAGGFSSLTNVDHIDRKSSLRTVTHHTKLNLSRKLHLLEGSREIRQFAHGLAFYADNDIAHRTGADVDTLQAGTLRR